MNQLKELSTIPSDLIRAMENASHRIDVALASELSASEIDSAISAVNELVRDPFVSPEGDFLWLDDANLDSWIQALEQDGLIEIPAHFSKSGRPEIIRRRSIGGSR